MSTPVATTHAFNFIQLCFHCILTPATVVRVVFIKLLQTS